MTTKIDLTSQEIAEAVAYWLTNAKKKSCAAKSVRVYVEQELRGHGATEGYVPAVKCQAVVEGV